MRLLLPSFSSPPRPKLWEGGLAGLVQSCTSARGAPVHARRAIPVQEPKSPRVKSRLVLGVLCGTRLVKKLGAQPSTRFAECESQVNPLARVGVCTYIGT